LGADQPRHPAGGGENTFPTDKLKIAVDMVLTFLERDRALRTLFLFEGRRIRGDGHLVVVTPGFLEFIKFLDVILKEMAAKGNSRQTLTSRRFDRDSWAPSKASFAISIWPGHRAFQLATRRQILA